MGECKFCKIAKGEKEEEHVFMENKNNLAFLDIYPVTKGQTLVIPKKHYGGTKIFEMPEKEYQKLFSFAKRVTEHLKKSLDPRFVVMVVEGSGVNHAHIKLYPTYRLGNVSEEEPVYPEEWRGTWGRRGPRADESKLRKLARKLRNQGSLQR